jgi:hypothetical protein
MTKVFNYECFAGTLSFAESLGWKCWLDEIMDETEPDTIDQAEEDALDYIVKLGYEIKHPEYKRVWHEARLEKTNPRS